MKNDSLNQLLQLRSSFVPEEFLYQSVCPFDTEYIKPRAAMNSAGEFMFIVNEPDGLKEYFQIVKVSICSDPEQECGDGNLFSSKATKCTQQYSDRKLLALSNTGEELIVDTFSFPSCCTCMVKDGFEF